MKFVPEKDFLTLKQPAMDFAEYVMEDPRFQIIKLHSGKKIGIEQLKSSVINKLIGLTEKQKANRYIEEKLGLLFQLNFAEYVVQAALSVSTQVEPEIRAKIDDFIVGLPNLERVTYFINKLNWYSLPEENKTLVADSVVKNFVQLQQIMKKDTRIAAFIQSANPAVEYISNYGLYLIQDVRFNLIMFCVRRDQIANLLSSYSINSGKDETKKAAEQYIDKQQLTQADFVKYITEVALRVSLRVKPEIKAVIDSFVENLRKPEVVFGFLNNQKWCDLSKQEKIRTAYNIILSHSMKIDSNGVLKLERDDFIKYLKQYAKTSKSKQIIDLYIKGRPEEIEQFINQFNWLDRSDRMRAILIKKCFLIAEGVFNSLCVESDAAKNLYSIIGEVIYKGKEPIDPSVLQAIKLKGDLSGVSSSFVMQVKEKLYKQHGKKYKSPEDPYFLNVIGSGKNALTKKNLSAVIVDTIRQSSDPADLLKDIKLAGNLSTVWPSIEQQVKETLFKKYGGLYKGRQDPDFNQAVEFGKNAKVGIFNSDQENKITPYQNGYFNKINRNMKKESNPTFEGSFEVISDECPHLISKTLTMN